MGVFLMVVFEKNLIKLLEVAIAFLFPKRGPCEIKSLGNPVDYNL